MASDNRYSCRSGYFSLPGGTIMDESDQLLRDLFRLRDSFKDRYKSLMMLKGKSQQAKAAKRAYLDINKVCKIYKR